MLHLLKLNDHCVEISDIEIVNSMMMRFFIVYIVTINLFSKIKCVERKVALSKKPYSFMYVRTKVIHQFTKQAVSYCLL